MYGHIYNKNAIFILEKQILQSWENFQTISLTVAQLLVPYNPEKRHSHNQQSFEVNKTNGNNWKHIQILYSMCMTSSEDYEKSFGESTKNVLVCLFYSSFTKTEKKNALLLDTTPPKKDTDVLHESMTAE